MENKNITHDNTSSVNVGPSVRPSLFQTLESVKEQVEYHAFGQTRTRRGGGQWIYLDPIFDELCLIIAEIYVMNPDAAIKINKEDTGLHIVQEVYQQLTNEHLQQVYDSFKEIQSKIYNKKSYLRTALYNVIFEHNAHYTNAVQSGYGK